MPHLTTLGTIHASLASLGILVGAVQFLRPKGGSAHRAVGYGYVYAMIVADCAALLVFQFTGRLNILHFGAAINLASIAAGLWPVLRSPRQPTWRKKHYFWISWSYVGLLAAAATELVVRTVSFGSVTWVWTATFATTALVTLTGRTLILRHAPARLDDEGAL